jgi:hypothetical protein
MIPLQMGPTLQRAPRRRTPFRITNGFVIFPGAFLTALGEGMPDLGLVFFLRERYRAGPILIGWFVGLSVLYRVALAFFWPPAMGWSSVGVEGRSARAAPGAFQPFMEPGARVQLHPFGGG